MHCENFAVDESRTRLSHSRVCQTSANEGAEVIKSRANFQGYKWLGRRSLRFCKEMDYIGIL
jgi:hypothetical protein